jgi:hypothetical protein
MFLNWCINNDFISEELKEDHEEEIQSLKRREITGAEFIMDFMDGKFSEYDLNETGNAFAHDYYKDDTDFGNRFSSFADDYVNFSIQKRKRMITNMKLLSHRRYVRKL